MSVINKIKGGLKGVFVAAGLSYVGLMPQENDFDPTKDYSASDEQILLLKKLSKQYDFVLLGDTDHESPYVTLYAKQPQVIDALKDEGNVNIYLEQGPKRQLLLDKGLDDPEFQQKCKDGLIGMWLHNDQAEEEICNSISSSIDDPNVNFMAVDQRHADGVRPLGKSTVILDKLKDTQEFFFGKTDGGSPTMMLAITALYHLNGAQLLDDTNTVDAIVGNGSGAIFYGANHYQYKENSEGAPIDMRSLLEQKGYSVAVVNIHESEKTRNILNNYFYKSDSGADVDFVVFPEKGNNGIHILNSDIEGNEKYLSDMQANLDIM